MSHYAVDIDLSHTNTSHTQVAELVGRDKRVLDVGCWTGDLGAVLARDGGCVVDGFEIDEEAAAVAADRLERVVVGNLDRTPLSGHFDKASYDVVVFADVLEHVVDPVAVLRDAAALLRADGYVVISVPNVTHGSVRLSLLQGTWNTTDTGILDHTHTKFFSRAGLRRMVEQSDFVIEDLRGTLADPLAVEVLVDVDRLPPGAIEWVRDQEDAFVYQFQARARVRTSAAQTSVEELQPAARLTDVRPIDRHTEQRMRDERDALARRDHVIGLQAQATAARLRAEKAVGRSAILRERVAAMRERMRRKDRTIADLERQIGDLRHELVVASAGWAGLARSAARRVRRR